ncbi:MAG: hypothetical protein J7M14_06590 [Planctomycetes bacterium]|nr:hypothetical protein [Planctomycetota bacterium]
MNEYEDLEAQLNSLRSQRDNILDVIGQVGDVSNRRRVVTVNIILLTAILCIFGLDVIRQVAGWQWRYLPPMLLMELAVLVISARIFWMIHRHSKVDHFHFSMLNSIESCLKLITEHLTAIEKALDSSRPHVPAPPAEYPSEEEVETDQS